MTLLLLLLFDDNNIKNDNQGRNRRKIWQGSPGKVKDVKETQEKGISYKKYPSKNTREQKIRQNQKKMQE